MKAWLPFWFLFATTLVLIGCSAATSVRQLGLVVTEDFFPHERTSLIQGIAQGAAPVEVEITELDWNESQSLVEVLESWVSSSNAHGLILASWGPGDGVMDPETLAVWAQERDLPLYWFGPRGREAAVGSPWVGQSIDQSIARWLEPLEELLKREGQLKTVLIGDSRHSRFGPYYRAVVDLFRRYPQGLMEIPGPLYPSSQEILDAATAALEPIELGRSYAVIDLDRPVLSLGLLQSYRLDRDRLYFATVGERQRIRGALESGLVDTTAILDTTAVGQAIGSLIRMGGETRSSFDSIFLVPK